MTLNRTIAPLIRPLEHFEVLQPHRIVLPNGIPLCLLHAGKSGVVRLDILVNGGRFHQDIPLQALFANRMLREGTRQYSAAQIAEKLDYYGAWLELSSASEHAYITLYSLNKYLTYTLDIITSMLNEPTYPERELEIVLNNNIQKFLVNSSKVDFQAHRGLVRMLYGESHPCGRLIQKSDYHNITSDMLYNFYEHHYHIGNFTIYLSGDVTDETIRLVEQHLGSTHFGKDLPPTNNRLFSPVSSAEKHLFIEHPNAMQSAIRMGQLCIPQTHSDYIKFRILVTLLGGYFGSRLMSNIREKKGYTYGIFASLITYPGQGVMAIHAETGNEFVEPLIAEVYHEIERLHQELVSDDELRMVQNYMIGDLCRSHESPFSLTDAWTFVQVSGLPDSYYTETLETIKSITPNEIRKMAQRYLCKENLKEVVVGKKIS